MRVIFILLMTAFSAVPLMAAETPERGLSAAFNYPGLIIGPGESVELLITIRNTGRQDDSFLVTVLKAPEGWETEVRSFASVVTGLFLPGLDQATLTLAASPPAGVVPVPGEYGFRVKVESLDGVLSQERDCLVAIKAKGGPTAPLTLTTSHPAVRGPSDGRFSFSLDVKNQSGEDSLVGLSASVPDGWEAYFKPSYEDKQVSSIQIPKGQSRALTLDVSPGFRAGVGGHPVKVRAESKIGTAEAELTLELTGTYKLRLMPANELLSAAAEAGKPVSLTFFLINEGSAVQRQVKFMAVAPDDWKVEFNPEQMVDVEPGRTPAPITATITPSDKALVGDYGLGLLAEGERAKSPVDLRITVRASTGWTWVGGAAIVLALAGLWLTFRRFGRR